MSYRVTPKPKMMKPEFNRGPGPPPKDGVPATGQIQLRVTMARKNAYVRTARPRKLTEWIFQHLDKAANYEPTEHDGKLKKH